MPFAVRAALAAAALVTVVAPAAADARVAADAAAAKPTSFGVKSLTAQRSVRAGSTFRVRGSGHEAARPGARAPAGSPSACAAARPTARSWRLRVTGTPRVRLTRSTRTRRFTLRLAVPRQRARRAVPAARLRATRQRPRRLPLARAAGDPPRAGRRRPRRPPRAPAAAAAPAGGGGAAEPARAADGRELLLRDGRPLRGRLSGRRRRRSGPDSPTSVSSRPASDPSHKGFYHGGDLKGMLDQHRLHPGPRHDRDLAHAELQEQARPGPDGATGPPATTATGSPTSRRSTRTWGPTTTWPRSWRPRTPAG